MQNNNIKNCIKKSTCLSVSSTHCHEAIVQCKQWLHCCCWGMWRLLILISGICIQFRPIAWPVNQCHTFIFSFFFLKSKCKNLWESIRSFLWITRCWVEKYDRPGMELPIWLLLTTFLLSCYCPPFLAGHVCRIEMWGVFCPAGSCCTRTQENWSRVSRSPSLCTRCTLGRINLPLLLT